MLGHCCIRNKTMFLRPPCWRLCQLVAPAARAAVAWASRPAPTQNPNRTISISTRLNLFESIDYHDSLCRQRPSIAPVLVNSNPKAAPPPPPFSTAGNSKIFINVSKIDQISAFGRAQAGLTDVCRCARALRSQIPVLSLPRKKNPDPLCGGKAMRIA